VQAANPSGVTAESLGGSPTLVAIGNFDGVHLGHRSVLEDTVYEASNRGLVPVALTFDPHPTVAVGRPPPACLTRLDRKIELIQRIDPLMRVVVEHFDAAYASQSPEQFVQRSLVDRLHAAVVRVGENFRFGAARSGDLAKLLELGAIHGFEARCEPLLGDDHGRFSSTRARECVQRGDLEGARHVLGRPHALCGTVIEGQKRARTLGFPTANLAWVVEALPPHGVYTVAVDLVENGVPRRLGLGVTNVGIRPTVDAGFAVEVHVFDYEGDLYGRNLRVHVLSWIRPERKFEGLDELKAQIATDVKQARKMLTGVVPNSDAGPAWY